ncbi:MAG: hypothetical protein CVU66_02550 [Deltaproteobacteria bacterium HGW-Deltaproteobacteria-23]|nr:MAG: hypothetical protein CVU66_02550 [Deltaproteobacteria bacterium HGW-Deltaproteobacteria-23]
MLYAKSITNQATNHNDQYRKLLKSIAPRRVYICPYPGNSGDELIIKGTHALLENMGIKKTMNASKADLLLSPGGNPTMWQGVINVLRDIWRRYPLTPFIIGPSTFQSQERSWIEEIWRSGANVKGLVARDQTSFEVLRTECLPPKIDIFLAHDSAFYLRESIFLKNCLEGVKEDHDLCAFRRDHEAGDGQKQSFSFLGVTLPDLLLKKVRNHQRKVFRKRKLERAAYIIDGRLPVIIRDVSLMNFDMFLDMLIRARHVHTDRLHVMICAALLQKKVYVYPTSYGKLEAVFRHSMHEWADCEFVPVI